MANWETFRVRDIIEEIKNESIVLPVIQRRLVWSEAKMKLLFDSLLKGNSFGSIICIKEEIGTEPLFASRYFTRDGNNVGSIEHPVIVKTQRFIIDGQQRLQSFYLGLVGTYKGKHLFFDLYSDLDNGGDYNFEFAVKREDIPQVNSERSDGACLWHPIYDIFERLSRGTKDRDVARDIIEQYKVKDTGKVKCIETNIQDFSYAIFLNKNIGISEVSIDKGSRDAEKETLEMKKRENRQRIVDLFIRLNDGGTKLSAYDLIASMLKGFDAKMEEYLETVVSENSDIGINQDKLIKLLLILNDKPSKELSDLTDEKAERERDEFAEFATSNGEQIKTTLVALKKFLNAKKFYDWFAVSQTRSAIPLYFLAYHIFHSKIKKGMSVDSIFNHTDTTDIDANNMAIWLRKSVLNKVFTRGCGWIPDKSGINKIHAVMKDIKGVDFPSDALLNVYINHPLRFQPNVTTDNLDSFDEEFFFYLLYDSKPSIRRNDIDHIHPSSLLSAKGIYQHKIDSIANFQLLDFRTNRGSKRAKEFKEWIENGGVSPEIIEEYLNIHLIPKDRRLWLTSAFDEFLKERSKLLAEKINSFL